tara:strand:- start:591 stop:1661 length:1071 start_codon:yes stop_codon:yes gene_type:complete
MKFTYLGNSNIKVSKICLGTMTFGEQNSKKQSFELMDSAYDKGVNFFDTAEMYPSYPKKKTYGMSEKIIGKWVKSKHNRDKVIIASKVASNHPKGIGATKLSWIRKGGENLQFDKKNLNTAIDQSLKRLNTDYIDLYQLHWPERNVPIFGQLDFDYDKNEKKWTPIHEVLENLQEIIKSGKIRCIGISNETPWGYLNFLNLAKEKKLPKISTIQNGYSLVNRIFDLANSEISLREKCGLLSYSPLAGGRLSGKYIKKINTRNSRYTLWPKRFSRHNTKRGEVAIKKYVKLSKKYDLNPSVFANAFVLSRPFLTSSIIGATSLKQLNENISSININFTEEMMKDVQNIHLSDPNPCY